jgi:hypothetical protein
MRLRLSWEKLEFLGICHNKKEGDDNTRWTEEGISSKTGKPIWSVWATCMWIPDKEQKDNLKEDASFQRAETIIKAFNRCGQTQKFDFLTSICKTVSILGPHD